MELYQADPSHSHYRDSFFYADLSEHLLVTGQENRFVVLFEKAADGLSPYHYFDLWFNALLCFSFGQPAVDSLFLTTYPLLCTITLIGILALAESFKPGFKLTWLLAPLLITCSSILPIRELNYHFATAAAEAPIEPLGQKFMVYYPFILLFFLRMRSDPGPGNFIFLLPLCVISISTVPGLFLFFFVLATLQPDKPRVRYLLFGKVVVVIILLIIFYSYNDTNLVNEPVTSPARSSYWLESLNWKGKMADIFIGFCSNLWHWLCNYLHIPLIALCILSRKDFCELRPFCHCIFYPRWGVLPTFFG